MLSSVGVAVGEGLALSVGEAVGSLDGGTETEGDGDDVTVGEAEGDEEGLAEVAALDGSVDGLCVGVSELVSARGMRGTGAPPAGRRQLITDSIAAP